jgi:hypothetical protein
MLVQLGPGGVKTVVRGSSGNDDTGRGVSIVDSSTGGATMTVGSIRVGRISVEVGGRGAEDVGGGSSEDDGGGGGGSDSFMMMMMMMMTMMMAFPRRCHGKSWLFLPLKRRVWHKARVPYSMFFTHRGMGSI